MKKCSRDENGTWHIDEDEVALLENKCTDTTNDQGITIVEWHPSTENENWTITSQGVSSSEAVSGTPPAFTPCSSEGHRR